MYYLLETFANLSPTAIWQWRYETLQSLSGWHHSHEPAGHTTLRGSCFARCEWQQVPTGRWYPDPLARLLLTPLLTACLNSSPSQSQAPGLPDYKHRWKSEQCIPLWWISCSLYSDSAKANVWVLFPKTCSNGSMVRTSWFIYMLRVIRKTPWFWRMFMIFS